MDRPQRHLILCSIHFALGVTEFGQPSVVPDTTYLLGRESTVAENLGSFPGLGNSPSTTSVAPFHYYNLHMAPPILKAKLLSSIDLVLSWLPDTVIYQHLLGCIQQVVQHMARSLLPLSWVTSLFM